MKVYNKVVIDIHSGETIYEDSYEYLGEVSLAKGGGGGGGGSGEVDYPPYMKHTQADWLAGGEPDGTGLVTLTAGNDITSLLDAAIGSSPFASASAYDPASELTSMYDAILNYCNGQIEISDLDAYQQVQDFITAIESFDSSSYDDDAKSQLTAFRNYIDSISTTVGVESELSKFDAGMANINAVNSSSFGVGHQIVAGGLIEAKLQAEKGLGDAHTNLAQLQLKKGLVALDASKVAATMALQTESEKAKLLQEKRAKVAHYHMERLRMSVAAKVEEMNKNIKLDKNDALWDLEAFQGASNVLASIGGGAVSSPAMGEEISDGKAALSGAMSGASMGSYFGPWGTAIGGAIGGIAGLLS